MDDLCENTAAQLGKDRLLRGAAGDYEADAENDDSQAPGCSSLRPAEAARTPHSPSDGPFEPSDHTGGKRRADQILDQGEAINVFFKIRERGSSIWTEVRAGLATFLTMCYILASLNPHRMMADG